VTPVRHLGAHLLGAVVALASVAVHREAFPIGAFLAIGTTFAVAWWLLRSRHPRTAATYVAGWLAVLAVVIAGRPEGDYALANDLAGYTLMGTGLLLVAVALVALTGSGRSNT